MRSAFAKETLRSISRSLGRFLAIAGIVALGAGFYAGLRMTAPDMRVAADIFYDDTALMDVRVVSSLGLSDDDLSALAEIEGVEAVMPARETDVLGSAEGEQYAMRVHSLPGAAASSSAGDGEPLPDEAALNRLVLVDGRWPTAPGECVVSADSVTKAPFAIGDSIEVTECSTGVDDTLAATSFEIVGTVRSSYYTSSSSLGATTLGTGSIQQVVFVPDDSFSSDFPVSEAFLSVVGARDLAWGSDAYDEAVAEVVGRIEEAAPGIEAARTDAVRADARSQLDDARDAYERQRADAEAQLAGASAELDAAFAELSSGEAGLAAAQRAYDEGVAELAAQRSAAEQELAAQRSSLDEAAAALDAARPEIERTRAAVEAGFAQAGMGYDEARAAIDGLRSSAAAALERAAALEAADPPQTEEAARLREQAAEATAQADGLSSLVAGQDAVSAFDAQEAQLAAGRQALADAESASAAQPSEAEARLGSASAQLSSSRSELASGWSEYADGLAAADEAQTDAEAGFAAAEAKLADAEAALADIEQAKLFVLDRSSNVGAASFDADAGRVDSIASLFPFVFFLVAALVSLTTMTRMVEEERVLIGTFKALGLGRARIASKYLAYAAAASGIGGVVGIAVLSQILPWVIQHAYTIIYVVPVLPAGRLPVDPGLTALSLGIGVGVTIAATWAAVAATLREKPAALMLPRAPKAGRRILLERVRPVWRRLSFSRKVTARNIFRYKKRLVMTIVGIAGCAALMLTGFGLSNAINDIIDNQFERILVYNLAVSTDGDPTDEERAAIDEALRGGIVERSTWVRAESMSATSEAFEGGGASDPTATFVVPSDPASFSDYVDMRVRTSGEPIVMDESSVVVTEKLADRLGIGPGDEIELFEVDEIGNATGSAVSLPVTDVMENYVYDYVYAGPSAYEEAFGQAPVYGSAYAVAQPDAGERAALSDELRSLPGVETVAFNDETIDTYRTMIDSVNVIVVVLVVSAAALAFIVLYNLTNINITERVREIATLKVLGFLPGEVRAYIYRETALLSLVGALVGMPLGALLEGFVVATAEVDQVMFGRVIHPESFVAAFALTMAFTAIVLFAMRCKLARIDMVESLKSAE